MAVSTEYRIFVEELFEPLGPVKVKKLFGGAGIFAPLPEGDVMFGLIAQQSIYLKVGDENRRDFEDEGMTAFTYGREGKRGSMSYYEMPERLYDDPDELVEWARKALDAALKSRTGKRKKKAG